MKRNGVRLPLLLAAVGILWLAATSGAFAHAHLQSSLPQDGGVISEPVSEVVLHFSEPVEVRFSTFKVYPLHSDETDPVRLRAAASALTAQALSRRGDENERQDAGVATTARISPEIVIRLKEGMEPGHYVVMWRVLSIDTHTTQGFLVFTFQPEAQE